MTTEATPDRAAFDAFQVGAALGPIEQTLDAEMVKRYADSLGTGNDWWTRESPFGGPIVPPTILENLASRLVATAGRLDTKGGGLFAGIEVQYLRPVPVGTTVRISGVLADKYIRRDKYYLVTEFHVHGEKGDEVMNGRILQARLPDPAQARVQ